MGLDRRSLHLLGAAALSLSVAGGAVAGTAGTALAAKAKPKPHATPTKKHHGVPAKRRATGTNKATAHHIVAGVVTAVDTRTHTVTVKVGKRYDTFATTGAKVTDLGKTSTAAGLKSGEHVRVTYTGKGTLGLRASVIAITKA